MLKKFMLSVAVVAALAGFEVEVAEAGRRLGGGRNTGIQRSLPAQRQATPPAATPSTPQQAQAARSTAQPTPGAQAPASGWRKWAGPLAGLAAGIGLAALLSHLGVGAEFAGILLAVLAGIVVIALVRRFLGGARSASPQPAYAGMSNADRVTPFQREAAPASAFGGAAAGSSVADTRFPAGFDADAFARQAKLNFIRLQAANDACNLADIRDFTSPEVFAEIKLGIDERGGAKQKTDIVILNAEVLEVAEEHGQYIASVHYSGSLREEEGAAAAPFDEIWHLTKPTDGNRGWVLAGIQQLN